MFINNINKCEEIPMEKNEYKISEQKIKVELDKEAAQINQKKCVKKVLAFYNKNREQCESAFKNYNAVKNSPRDYIDSQETFTAEQFAEMTKSKPLVLILTANDIENKILIWNLRKESGNNVKSILIDDNSDCVNINYCSFKEYNVIHHHVGRTGDEATRRAINELTQYFLPTFIILLGICYGLDMDKQEIGYVNISEQVMGVRINFRDRPKSDEIIFEPEVEFEERPNDFFVSTITKKLNNAEIKEGENGAPINHMYGRIVSANSLMSCKIVKDSIIGKLKQEVRGRSTLIGGEMEACGVFKSNYRLDNRTKFDRWLIIISICDWGESKNSLVENEEENALIKDSLQAYAMMNSCILFAFLLKNKAFR